MEELINVIVYPVKQEVLLLFSMTFDGVSVGSLIIAALLIAVIFRLFIGQHMLGDVFEDVHAREDRERHRLRLADERESKAEAYKEMRRKQEYNSRHGLIDGYHVNFMDDVWEED